MTNLPTNEAFLYLLKGGDIQFDITFPLPSDSEITLGRDPNCDILLDLYDNVSRRHAVIRPVDGQPGKWMIADLNSSNGTFINGRRLEKEHILKAKDKINIAKNGPCFQFEYKQPLIIPQTKNSLAISHQRTIQEESYDLLLFPTKLTIALKGYTSFYTKVNSYTFDLDSEQLIISFRRSLSDWLFGYYPSPEQHPLRKFTAVRLDKSEYEGTRGTKYLFYIVNLQQEYGEYIPIETKCRIVNTYGYTQIETGIEKLEKAEQIVNIIEQYLELIE